MNNPSLHGIVRNQDKVSCQAYETSVSKKRLHAERTTLNFVVKYEQRFPLFKRANNAYRILMVLSETKGALVITVSQLYCLFPVGNLRICSCLACVYRVMDARGKFGEHEKYVRVARSAAESNSSFLSALQTSQVHP